MRIPVEPSTTTCRRRLTRRRGLLVASDRGGDVSAPGHSESAGDRESHRSFGRRGSCRHFPDVAATMLMIALAIVAGPSAIAEIGMAVAPSVAIRGSDLIVPLRSSDPDEVWPATLPARIGDLEIEAVIAWLTPRAVEAPRWTTPATPVAVKVLEREGTMPAGTPIAVIPVPEDADGSVEFLGTSWTPQILDAGPPFDADRRPATRFGVDADPVLDDPMEWFRWAVRAELESSCPPVPTALSPLERRVAVSVAAEWRAGLQRVAAASPGIAEEIATRLVATVVDDTRPRGRRLVAAWPTSPRELSGLRAILLDPDRTPMESAQGGLAWFEARPPFLAWVLEPGGDRVVVELANPTAGELVVLASWTDGGHEQALLLPPRSLTTHQVERPDVAFGSPPEFEELVLTAESRTRRLLLGRRAISVRPPGGPLGTLGLARTLAAMNAEYEETPPPEASTVAILRRHDQRWEIFVEARDPGMPADGDRLTLQFGTSENPVAVLEVRADGARRVLRGQDDGTLEVRTHRVEGLWRAVVVVPERWLVGAIGRSRGGVVLLGLRRTGPGDLTTFAGPPPPAWRADIPVQAFALADWGDPGGPPGEDGVATDVSSTGP